ncbi:hypothetical protein [Metabacillus sp. B2-18]|uniref:hypothetical protein n=1 Tax=Metabacillus sp. B2-18 TaxID=2897333 RepID=UPI001E6252FF|nr:hypothetical protein [Metabacillus sp. B2-18]UGB30555.1 hypothetical protein LPC09_23130 [Metabacillus sp. B2-18]
MSILRVSASNLQMITHSELFVPLTITIKGIVVFFIANILFFRRSGGTSYLHWDHSSSKEAEEHMEFHDRMVRTHNENARQSEMQHEYSEENNHFH